MVLGLGLRRDSFDEKSNRHLMGSSGSTRYSRVTHKVHIKYRK